MYGRKTMETSHATNGVYLVVAEHNDDCKCCVLGQNWGMRSKLYFFCKGWH